jgi:hypothetical protein
VCDPTVALHDFPFIELQGTVEETVWLEIRTSFPASALQAQEQVYVFGGGGLDEGGCGVVERASADPESASIAAMAAGIKTAHSVKRVIASSCLTNSCRRGVTGHDCRKSACLIMR